MTDEIVNDNGETAVDYKSMVESLTAELEKTKKHNEELFSETKAAKQAKAQESAEKQRIEKERAQKEGEFEKLWQTAEEMSKSLEQELLSERNSYKQEKIQSHAMKLAIDLADGDALSAKLLATFIGHSIAKMADEKGALTDDVLVAVKKEFQNNADYAPLLAGSKASGGGALGNTKTTAQAVDSKLSPVDRMNASRQGK